MKNNSFKKILFAILIVGALLGAAYFLSPSYIRNKNINNNISNNNVSNKNTTQNQSSINPQKDLAHDEEVENKLRQENDVKYAYINITPKLIFAPIILQEGAKKENAPALVNKYADLLKAKYNDREISVQALGFDGKVAAETRR
jgi:hypothetical protein